MARPERIAKMEAVASRRQYGAVVIEDVYDPHNAEAVFRSCDAFGFQQVYLIFDKQSPFDPRAVGKLTSAAANKWLDFHIFDDTTTCLQALKADEYTILATVLADDAVSVYDADLTMPRPALLLGNEHSGLSATAVALADKKVIIPMEGFVQSFNLSVTASVFMYEMTRQRRQRGMAQYRIGEDAQAALAADWLQRRSGPAG